MIVSGDPNGDHEGETKCKHCDHAGGVETYKHQVCMPLSGKVRCIDYCIHQIIAALNAGGIDTASCCCGHGTMPGRIDLMDGRVLTITKGSCVSEQPHAR